MSINSETAAAGMSGVRTFGQRSAMIAAPFILLALAWQAAGFAFPPFLFPPLKLVAAKTFEILISWTLLIDVLLTVMRIMYGLVGAFLIGSVLALLMHRSKIFDQMASPILTFFQGIPALSWVVFAIIWFHGTEPRIFFIMVMTTLPAFTFQILDALKNISRDLAEMVLSFRPTRWKMFKNMIFPAILPEILTAWKVNIGNASRVVVVAELVGATGGVGYQLLLQQQLFDMAGALAWTMQLVIFVILVQQAIAAIESFAFRYRAVSERGL